MFLNPNFKLLNYIFKWVPRKLHLQNSDNSFLCKILPYRGSQSLAELHTRVSWEKFYKFRCLPRPCPRPTKSEFLARCLGISIFLRDPNLGVIAWKKGASGFILQDFLPFPTKYSLPVQICIEFILLKELSWSSGIFIKEETISLHKHKGYFSIIGHPQDPNT